MQPDIATITQAILQTTTDPHAIVEMAYELGVSHGRSQLAQERQRKPRIHAYQRTPGRDIATLTRCRSRLEEHWLTSLYRSFHRISYEPERFQILLDGKRTSYTPEFRCVTTDGRVIWIGTKPRNWRALRSDHGSDAMQQLRRMQACVRRHHIHLFVCVGEPGHCTTYQVLGLNIDLPSAPETLRETAQPW